MRTAPNDTLYDNYLTKGNINPYTEKEGTKNYDSQNNYGSGLTLAVTNGRYFESQLLCDKREQWTMSYLIYPCNDDFRKYELYCGVRIFLRLLQLSRNLVIKLF